MSRRPKATSHDNFASSSDFLKPLTGFCFTFFSLFSGHSIIKKPVLLGLLVFLPCFLSAQAAVTIDTALSKAADYFTGLMPEGSKLAVLNIKSENTAISNYVLEELSALIVNGRKLVVVDRSNLDLIRQEENFHLSGEVSDESAQRIGQKLGAQTIISGSMDLIGNYYRLRVRALEVETARIQGVFTTDVRRNNTLIQVERAGNTGGGTIQPDEWNNKRFYLGARVGLVQGMYGSAGDLFPASTTLTGGLSFDAGLYGAVSVFGLFEIQAEALVSGNNFDIARGTNFKSVAYTSLEIPFLAKLVWRPSIFMVQGYGGIAVSIPLGQVTVKHSNGTLFADYGVVPGFVVGGGGGIKLGPGVLLGDIRYTGDFDALTANISGNRKISQRSRVSFALSYEIGFFQK
jgi:TolB-like protein